MNYSHSTVSGVDTLTSSTSRPERINAQILWIDVNVKLHRHNLNLNHAVDEHALKIKMIRLPPQAEAG